jgi:hypothetical protein
MSLRWIIIVKQMHCPIPSPFDAKPAVTAPLDGPRFPPEPCSSPNTVAPYLSHLKEAHGINVKQAPLHAPQDK